MTRLKLTLEYDGTAYAGWQRQPNQPTVQGAIEEAIRSIAQTAVSVVGAGRTDAGVHALGQVAHVDLDHPMSPSEWLRALNAVLPQDISVIAVDPVPDEFHARYSARGKLYEYRILNRRERSALERGRSWHVSAPLKTVAMAEAAHLLVGHHDFSSFEGAPTDNENPICHLHGIEVTASQDRIRIEAYADRFLKQMVRALVGTLVDVGAGKRTVDSVREVLEARDRSKAGKTAPAHGLFLVRVDY